MLLAPPVGRLSIVYRRILAFLMVAFKWGTQSALMGGHWKQDMVEDDLGWPDGCGKEEA